MADTKPVIEARYYSKEGGDCICGLCPHHCRISPGKTGLCRARYNNGEKLIAKSYACASAVCADPIEKKPLYHYRPGTMILSVGGVGCNMRCKQCQNHSISQISVDDIYTEYVPPKALTRMCRISGMDALAFTYNEPSVWFEYIMDTINDDPGIRYVLVTNGLIEEAPLKELCQYVKAMNIDIKGFTEGAYRETFGAELSDVLRTVKTVFEEGVHLEITYLLIPGINDSEKELHEFSRWIADNLSKDIPVHFTKFHPDYKMMDIPATPDESLISAKDIAKEEGLAYIYLGNTNIPGENDTLCQQCDNLLIRRNCYKISMPGLDGDKCSQCGKGLEPFRTE